MHGRDRTADLPSRIWSLSFLEAGTTLTRKRLEMGQTASSALLSTYRAPEPLLTLAGSLGISYCAYVATSSLIPRLRKDFIAKGLKGIDLLKGYERDDGGKLKGPAL